MSTSPQQRAPRLKNIRQCHAFPLRRIVAVAAGLLGVFPAAHASGSDTACFERPFAISQPVASEVCIVRLDGHAYRHTGPDFADLRIIDRNGAEVPFALRPVTATDTTLERRQVPARLRGPVVPDNNSLTLVYETDTSGPVADELHVATPVRNFEKQVSVFGSNDTTTWHLLVRNSPIYDYSRFVDARMTTVPLPQQRFSRYKVVIDSIVQSRNSPFSHIVTAQTSGAETLSHRSFLQHQEPFRVDEVTLSGAVPVIRYGRTLSCEWPLTIASVHQDSAARTSVLTCESDCQPIQAVRIRVSQSNFKRSVTIQGSTPGPDTIWQPITTGEIFSVSAAGVNESRLMIPLHSANRFPQYRIIIHNGDNPALQIDSVRAEGYVHEVLFFHRGMSGYTLRYGAFSLHKPRYDVAEVLAATPPFQGELLIPGSPVSTTCASLEPARTGAVISTRWILIGTLVTMVIVLVVLLIKMAGKIDTHTRVR